MESRVSLVWRVENAQGWGPYVGELQSRWIRQRGPHQWHCCHCHPAPIQDVKRYAASTEFCGFATRADALRWFSRAELQRLRAIGYELKQVRGIITARGRQVLFRKVSPVLQLELDFYGQSEIAF